MGQLADAKGRIAQAGAEEQQNKVKLDMAEKELKALSSKSKEVAKEAKDNEAKLQRVQAEVDECRRKMEKSGWNVELEKDTEDKLRNAKAEVQRFTEVPFLIYSRLSYANPYFY
jgi:structural maintenance of chromosome 2